MSEIDVSKYFKNYRNEYGLTFAIEYIGDPKDLIREIKQQNELLISYKEENIELHYKLGKQKGTIEKIKEEIGENKELRCSLDMGKKILQIIEEEDK